MANSFWESISSIGEKAGDFLERVGSVAGGIASQGADVILTTTNKVGDLVASDNPGTRAVVGLILDRLGLGIDRDMGSERPEAGQGRIVLYDTGGSRYGSTSATGSYGSMSGLSGTQLGLLAGLGAVALVGVVLVARR